MLITPLFAAIFGLFYILLSLNIVRHRLSKNIVIGDGEDKTVERAIRAHANFIEYVPFSLILFYFIEIITLSSGLVFLMASALLIARICHFIGMVKPRELFILRQIGASATFAVILIASLSLALRYIPISV